MYTRHIIFVGILLLMGGCTSLDIKDFDAWQPVDLEKSELAPTDLANSKFVVANFREPPDPRVKGISSLANLASLMMGTTEKYLTDAGIEVVSRNDAQKLLGEVQLAEQKGKVGGYKGPVIAQYVIVGHIDSVDTSAEFQEASEYVTKKGERIYTPPKCKYEANVTGTIRVYTVPKLIIAKSVSMRGTDNTSEDSRGNCENNPAKLTALIREAGDEALYDASTKFQNFFAPHGYIIEMRKSPNGKDSIIKVTIGSNRGLKIGKTVEVFTKTLQNNPLTEESTQEERKVTTGRVTNQVGESYAWIMLDEPELANRLKIGDYVKMKFEKSWFKRATGKIKEKLHLR
jgi:hypothetical protein